MTFRKFLKRPGKVSSKKFRTIFLETSYPSKYWSENYDMKAEITCNWLMKSLLIFTLEIRLVSTSILRKLYFGDRK